jgi:hypothetical protein
MQGIGVCEFENCERLEQGIRYVNLRIVSV